jgi:hypothetical protein
LQFLLIKSDRQAVDASPLFFDTFFPSIQSTTPESVVADYRQRKRADSRAEHAGDDHSNDPITYNGNNVEFVAEVIGKLIGTIRDGVTTLIDDVRTRKSQRGKVAGDAKPQKLMNHRANSTNSTDVTEMHRNSTETDTKQTTTTVAPSTSPSTASTPVDEVTKEHHEIQLASSTTHQHNDSSESDEGKNRGGGKIQSANESTPTLLKWDEVVQVIARRTKHKRSNSSAQQLEIPIDSDSTDDGEMTNERSTSVNGHEEHATAGDDDAKWFRKHHQLFAKFHERHRMRKEKFIRFVRQFLAPTTDNDAEIIDELESTLTDDDVDATLGPSEDDDSKFSFAITKGNTTVVHVSPFQILRMFHRGSDEHEEFRLWSKATLQRAFYKYARIYLKARKGYKEVRSFNKKAKESLQENEENSPTLSPLEVKENHAELRRIDDENEINFEGDENNFMTSGARVNFQTIEALAILLLEIFGALFAISLGAIGQLQGVPGDLDVIYGS